MCKNVKKAYMTVEASVVFSMVFGGIIFTIYLGIYLYNVSVMKQISYIAALRGSQLTSVSSGEMEEYIKEELDNLLNSKILMKENIEQEIKVTSGKVKVKLKMNMLVLLNKGIFSEIGLWEIENEAEVKRYDPVDFIRKVKGQNASQISKRFIW